jgi:hypothetical protein
MNPVSHLTSRVWAQANAEHSVVVLVVFSSGFMLWESSSGIGCSTLCQQQTYDAQLGLQSRRSCSKSIALALCFCRYLKNMQERELRRSLEQVRHQDLECNDMAALSADTRTAVLFLQLFTRVFWLQVHTA